VDLGYNLKEKIDMAAGRRKSELVLKNASIVNVFTQEILKGDIALAGDIIVGIGNYEGEKEIDLKGGFAAPGFIDGHMHLESTMVLPSELSAVLLARGTTTVVADPHEIVNVCGIDGIRFIMDQAKKSLLDIFIMLPSCVPATPHDSPGARFDETDMEKLVCEDRVLGLGEFMDFKGVVEGRSDVLKKLKLFRGGKIDGHAPGLSGKALNAYAVAGIRTEHEAGSVEEMLEKLRLGFYILIREGSAAKDLKTLVNGVNSGNMRRCVFCTDDRHLDDILAEGHIDNNIRMAVEAGIDPAAAIAMATLNTAECYGLNDRGAIAPGYLADIVVLEDLKNFKINMVFKSGKITVGNKGWTAGSGRDADVPEWLRNTVRLGSISKDMLDMEMCGPEANIITLVPGSLATVKAVRKVSTENGLFICKEKSDPVKLAVMDRHRASGNIGLGLLDGFGIRCGAIASTISHDSHNLIVTGDNDTDMLLAAEELGSCGGGITICSSGKVLKTLPLPVAGLMSLKPFMEVEQDLIQMLAIARSLGIPYNIEPFMTLSFLALTVIPEIRLTEKGLFDVIQDNYINYCRT